MSGWTRCTLATETGEPDRAFPSLSALARELVRLRAGLPLGLKETPRELVATPAYLARSDAPSGLVIAVRARDPRLLDRGMLLGYAFMPPIAEHETESQAAERLMAVIREITADPSKRSDRSAA